ncbi:MAG: aa3-type cytochrome c oxidase subunit IV [Parasphingopyxis sp.]|nr:aa3-type cytochrome c oxidase subunit IV [uncultured Parasphingopyxis sp.]
MADDKSMEEHYAEMDYTAHDNTYSGFLGMLKGGIIATIIAVVIVFWAIT